MKIPWNIISGYAALCLFAHLLVVLGIRKLRTWICRLQITGDFAPILFSSLRLKIYILWALVAVVITATFFDLTALVHVGKAISSFLLCLIFGDLGVLLCIICFGKFIKNRKDVYPLLKKFLVFFFWVLGIVMAANNLGYSISGLLTTFGIGGAAVAFAAQNTLANLWATLSIVLDHPFKEGDWIVVGSRASGWVEYIGLRSTRLRTENDTEVTIPNSIMVNECIENKGTKNNN